MRSRLFGLLRGWHRGEGHRQAAPWFILGIMLFSYAVRGVYIESCSMFVRGGVYRVVREAMGGTAAKFSVSALLFDYVLTGPISAVSAGLYLAGLINESGQYFHWPGLAVPAPLFATGFAILVTLYFWHTNRVGIPFSSTKALRIMQMTTVMVVLLIGWCMLTIFRKGYQAVPPPTVANLHFSDEALGWLKGTAAPGITILAILIGLGHSLLAMSGEESLAQVNREIEAPKHKNLIRTGLVIFIFSLLFTSLVSFFAVMIIPDADRSRYFDNLIGGLSMFLVGPFALKLAFHAFVVLMGVLILSGAVNTAIIGSNGVLNRVAEDGVLPPRFRDPHPKYGTTHRIINVIVGLQLATILISRGDVYMLGEAYAFGVVWSFAMKALAVIVLRFTEPQVPRWRVPLNFRVGAIEVPLGLVLIATLLFLLAGINVVTKKVATISGMSFTGVLFVLFTICERYYKPKEEKHTKWAKQVMDECETRVFSKVVYAAEKVGKPVSLVAVAGKDPYGLILQAAQKLRSSRVVISPSAQIRGQEQAVGQAWEQLPRPRPAVSVEIVPDNDDQDTLHIDLGPHLLRPSAADEELAHRMWRELKEKNIGCRLHTRDILGIALRLMEEQLHSERAAKVLEEIRREVEIRESLDDSQNQKTR